MHMVFTFKLLSSRNLRSAKLSCCTCVSKTFPAQKRKFQFGRKLHERAYVKLKCSNDGNF